MEKKNIAGTIVKWCILIFLLIAVFYGFLFFREYTRKTDLAKGTEVSFLVKEGDGMRDIAAHLKEQDILDFQLTFFIRAAMDGYFGRFLPGEYTLNTHMSLVDMMEIMCTKKVSVVKETTRFTIPEGYSVEMIGARLEELGLCLATDFYEAANRTDYDYAFLSELPEETGTYALQGFLFPDTYEIYVDATAEDIVRKMLDGFQNHLHLLTEAEERATDYTLYELVTMASIVEREAKLEEERPTVAGVIYNRLEIDMKLQMCPTVLYIITNGMYDVNQVLYRDLEIDDPYNTYYYEGLPKGPICCPGAAALSAAAHPQTHSYLFYHTDDESVGNHIFTEKYEDHVNTQIKRN